MTATEPDLQRSPFPAASELVPIIERHQLRTGAHAELRRKLRFLTVPVSIAIGLVLWETISRLELVNPLFLPPFTEVVGELWPLLTSGELNQDFIASGGPFLAGIGLAAVIGISLGLLMGLTPPVNTALMPWVMVFNSIPRIALIPMIIVILGIGQSMHIFVVFMTAFFPILLNVASGSANVDQQLRQMATSFGAGRWLIIRKVILPATVPFMVAGLRLALGHALIGIIVAELFASQRGIGHRLFQSGHLFDTTGVYAMVIIIAFVGVLFNQVLGFFERRLNVWRTS